MPVVKHILATIALATLVSFFIRSDVRASDSSAFGETCSHLYTDEEALARVKAAEVAVPQGQVERKPIVMQRLGIEIQRLCRRRFWGLNLGAEESWQMSPGYDLTWWAGGPDSVPLDSEDAKISHIRIVPRFR